MSARKFLGTLFLGLALMVICFVFLVLVILAKNPSVTISTQGYTLTVPNWLVWIGSAVNLYFAVVGTFYIKDAIEEKSERPKEKKEA